MTNLKVDSRGRVRFTRFGLRFEVARTADQLITLSAYERRDGRENKVALDSFKLEPDDILLLNRALEIV